uniref:Polysaccharide pyruvyl transferase family protein n=1 Tax=Prevotella sp. GTC17253 TaxID=3236793 RepID=A0AB33IM06_9BACT
MKIGIITMHRVTNFGSALQAYALQQALIKLGYENEIINYIFPHKNKSSIFSTIELFLRKKIYELRTGVFFSKKKEDYFKEFRRFFLSLSDKTYTLESINTNPPKYDLYMTGSDQVWNPKWMEGDTNFLLSFVQSKPKVSYASSFAVNTIPAESKEIYKKYLQEYKHITVRENSGEIIVDDLLGTRKADVVCDPTILLDKGDYIKIAKVPRIEIQGPYILVYILDYMFNPYPGVNQIIKSVAATLGMPVVYIGGKYTVYDSHCKYIENLGPCEFIWLFQHADFVVTTSFHGSAFATIFQKPLLAVVKDTNDNDGRIITLMRKVGNERALISYTANIEYKAEYLRQLTSNNMEYQSYKEESLKKLQQIVENI